MCATTEAADRQSCSSFSSSLARSLAQLCLSSVSSLPPSLNGERGGTAEEERKREAKCSSLDVRGSLSDVVVVVEDCRSSFLHDEDVSESPCFYSETFPERFGPSKVNSTLEMSVT